MKSFDLTFSGAVLPEYDPTQVKQDFARLFAIQDNTLIEEIFSGKTILLRHNLDRKTAADYFRQINLLGGQAALVTSPKYRAVNRDEVLILEENNTDEPEVSEVPVQEPASEEFVGQVYNEPAPIELEVLTEQATQESQRMAAKLQRQKEQFDRISAEELDKIELLREKNRTKSQRELAELKVIEETTTRSATAQISDFKQQRASIKNTADRDIAQLEALVGDVWIDQNALNDDLDQHLKEIQHTAEADINRLQQLLRDRQQQAENDIADLQRQLQDAKSKSQLEIGQLEKKRGTALDATKVQFEELEQQEVEAREQLENHSAELKQRELEIQARESEEASRLQGMETDIISKRDQGIAKVEQAIDQLSTQTQATLQQLRISKLEVQAPQNQELGNNAIKSISGV